MPMLINRLARRWVYTIGCGLLFLGAIMLIPATLPAQLAGMLARVMGASALAIGHPRLASP